MQARPFTASRFKSKRGFRFIVLAALCCALVLPAVGQMQFGNRRLAVRVRDLRGAPLGTRVPVTLRARIGDFYLTAYTQEDGTWEFRGLMPGDYTLEVTVPGYLAATEPVSLPLQGSANLVPQVFVYLRRESDVDSSTASSSGVQTSSKAQKEILKARESLSKNDLKTAQKHLERALKAAPSHPEVHFLLGILYFQQQVPKTAQEHLEKALHLNPQYVPALRALARLLYQQGDIPGAIKQIEQALAVAGRSADDHMLLAEALLQQNELDKAAFHARQAEELSEAKKAQARLVICQVLMAQGKYAEAESALEAFLREFPEHADAATARSALQSVQQARASASASGTGGPAANGNDLTLRSIKPAETNPSAPFDSPEPAVVEVNWAPPDVDANPPAAFHDVPCDASEVLARASQRIQDMVGNLGDVAAEESVTHTEIDKYGQPGATETRRFSYEVSANPKRDGTLLRETRDGAIGIGAVRGFSTNAIAVMALVFHPYYSQDFDMRCEGQGVGQGQPVWFVHFQQRADKPARFHRLRWGGGVLPIPLKGRAWIAANSFEIVRLETTMVEPNLPAQLLREQMIIEYRPFRFEQRQRSFWLPASADIYIQYRGQRWHRRHVLSNYVHFAVDTHQKIAPPVVPDAPPPPM